MQSDIGKIDIKDIVRGGMTAAFGAVTATILVILNRLVSSGSFELTKQDGMLVLGAALIGFTSYIQKRFFSNKDGETFGSKKL